MWKIKRIKQIADGFWRTQRKIALRRISCNQEWNQEDSKPMHAKREGKFERERSILKRTGRVSSIGWLNS